MKNVSSIKFMQWTLINHCHRINRAKLCSLSLSSPPRWIDERKKERIKGLSRIFYDLLVCNVCMRGDAIGRTSGCGNVYTKFFHEMQGVSNIYLLGYIAWNAMIERDWRRFTCSLSSFFLLPSLRTIERLKPTNP